MGPKKKRNFDATTCPSRKSNRLIPKDGETKIENVVAYTSKDLSPKRAVSNVHSTTGCDTNDEQKQVILHEKCTGVTTENLEPLLPTIGVVDSSLQEFVIDFNSDDALTTNEIVIAVEGLQLENSCSSAGHLPNQTYELMYANSENKLISSSENRENVADSCSSTSLATFYGVVGNNHAMTSIEPYQNTDNCELNSDYKLTNDEGFACVPETIQETLRTKQTSNKSKKVGSKTHKNEKIKKCIESSDTIKFDEVRRSNRIKSICAQQKSSKGLVKFKKCTETVLDMDATENFNAGVVSSGSNSSGTVNTNGGKCDVTSDSSPQCIHSNIRIQNLNNESKPVKVKSRWRRTSELEMNVQPHNQLQTQAAPVMSEDQLRNVSHFNVNEFAPSPILPSTNILALTISDLCNSDALRNKSEQLDSPLETPQFSSPSTSSCHLNAEKNDDCKNMSEIQFVMKQFIHLKENLYLTERMTCKEAKKMICDCYLTPDEIDRGEFGCGEDCLNRLLMIECGHLCPIENRCTNRKFQLGQFAPVEVFKTDKKGLGIRATANIPFGEFILEYVGEVLNPEEFDKRADIYSNVKNAHYYFMSLRADAVIDATRKGNISRFINHSCEPNAETQKWTVNGELRIGFFSTRTILAGEEITFDYRFQRYGKEAQKCFCEAATCRGWLGEEPDDDIDEDDFEEENEDQKEILAETDEEFHKKSSSTPKPLFDNIERNRKREERIAARRERSLQANRIVRKEIFDDLDLDDEIEMLVTTGLKNQAQTLKLSRLIVRAKEPSQRTKLLRILRHGELPCRRLFLDYHGLRLMHGYMIDTQLLAKVNSSLDSLRLELLQTLATLPIPNRTLLQDSKVLPTVECWAYKLRELPFDSDSCSPQTDSEKLEVKELITPSAAEERVEIANTFDQDKPTSVSDATDKIKCEEPTELAVPTAENAQTNYDEEITALAAKLLEEWSSLTEVFKIPKKERIEQMKEHEREANRGYTGFQDSGEHDRKQNDARYRFLKRFRKTDKFGEAVSHLRHGKQLKNEDRNISHTNSPKNQAANKMEKFERRRMFALQVEQHEEERRRKQRELWRQHEHQCMIIGTDPRLTAPFDPNQATGFQCIWNPQIRQWQNFSIPVSMASLISSVENANMAPSAFGQIESKTTSYTNSCEDDPIDVSLVKFLGPIPPPVKLPPKWKSAKDQYGRPYYYHIKLRKSQWEPPPYSQPQNIVVTEQSSSSTSSSDTSSISSSTLCSEDESSNDETDNFNSKTNIKNSNEMVSNFYNCIQKPLEVVTIQLLPQKVNISEESDNKSSNLKTTYESLNSDTTSNISLQFKINDYKDTDESLAIDTGVTDNSYCNDPRLTSKDSIYPLSDNSLHQNEDMKHLENSNFFNYQSKRKRAGLVEEIIISPRTNEDRLQFREDIKRYKHTKEMLRKLKQKHTYQQKKHLNVSANFGRFSVNSSRDKKPKLISTKSKVKEMVDSDSDQAKRIRESFRSNMANVVVGVLNAYRKANCQEGQITSTEDFKHLARKLTHFVMLKEIKHITRIEDLVCTESVKAKAREYIRKYMAKFGKYYQKRNDEPDFL